MSFTAGAGTVILGDEDDDDRGAAELTRALEEIVALRRQMSVTPPSL